MKTPTNRKRSICIPPTSTKSKGHSVCSIYCSLGRRLSQPKLKNLNKMDDNSTCSFPVIEIDSQTNTPIRLDSQTNSPLRLDEKLMSSDEITVLTQKLLPLRKIHEIQRLTQYFLFLRSFQASFFLLLTLRSKLCLSFFVIAKL